MKPKLLLSFALVLSGVCHAAIIYPSGPDGGLQLVRDAISKVRQDDHFFGELRKEDAVVASPHWMYCAWATDLVSGHLLDAKSSGKCWVYPIMRGANIIGTATIIESATNTGKTLKLGSLGVPGKLGESVSGLPTPAFLRELEDWPQVKKQDYELRMLNLSDLSFEAIWLHAKADDIIIPFPWFSNPIVNAYQPYSEKQLVKILKPEAERHIKMWQKLRDQEQHNKHAYERAMMDYEKAHGGKSGPISLHAMGSIQLVEPDIWLTQLEGQSDACGTLRYKVKITFANHFNTVKQVEILEKMTPVKLKVVKVDSEETGAQNGYGANAVDGDPNTYWHTQWQSNSPGLPHEIIIELLPPSIIKGFTYLPRQDVSDHGTIKDYEFYISDDGTNFGQPVNKGAFDAGKEEKIKEFVPVKCRFIKLRAISEITGQPWTSAAEICVIEKDQISPDKNYWRGNLGPSEQAPTAPQDFSRPDDLQRAAQPGGPAIAPQDSTKPNALDSFVAMLSADGGMWQNGVDAIDGSQANTPEEVVAGTLRTAKFEAGLLTSYRIVSVRKVHIGQFPETYTAALLDTNLGQMVMLMQYAEGNASTPGHWWRRIYDAHPPIKRLY